jgi:hypothetical protein
VTLVALCLQLDRVVPVCLHLQQVLGPLENPCPQHFLGVPVVLKVLCLRLVLEVLYCPLVHFDREFQVVLDYLGLLEVQPGPHYQLVLEIPVDLLVLEFLVVLAGQVGLSLPVFLPRVALLVLVVPVVPVVRVDRWHQLGLLALVDLEVHCFQLAPVGR